MYRCDSWTTKKAECQRIDVFELWCWRRLLRVPWTARRSNQSILKEISPKYSLEGLMLKLKLKLQYSGHLIRTVDFWERPWWWERLKAKKGTRENKMFGWHYQLNGHEFEQTLGDSEEQGRLVCFSPWGSKETVKTERLNKNSSYGMGLWLSLASLSSKKCFR